MIVTSGTLHSGESGSDSGEGYIVEGGEYTNIAVDRDNLGKEYDEETGLPILRIDVFYV